MGAGALAGNPFGVDRQALAACLGFTSAAQNSIDAVSDRDAPQEAAAAAAILPPRTDGEEPMIRFRKFAAAAALIRERIDPAGKRAAVVGAGGTARAVAFALKNAGADVTLVAAPSCLEPPVGARHVAVGTAQASAAWGTSRCSS